MATSAPSGDDAPENSLTWMNYAPDDYARLLANKERNLRERFARILGKTAVDVFASQPSHFRDRARFAIERFGQDRRLSYALFDRGSPRVSVTQFPVASLAINELMPRLLDELTRTAVLHDGLRAVHFLGTQVGDMLVSLIYGAPLADDWRAAALAARDRLGLPSLVGRAKGTTIALDRPYVSERYTLADGRSLTYRQMEGSFSNPSAAMCEHTLNWLCTAAAEIAAEIAATGGADAGGDGGAEAGRRLPSLLELFCGNGNHTVALAPYFSRVLAVEIDSRLCDAARHNLINPANVEQSARIAPRGSPAAEPTVLCTPAGKFCSSLLRRLASAPPAERYDVCLVDPPRAGLDAHSLRLACRHDHILYISCNPSALDENLRDAHLDETHELRKCALFDHFPFTEHSECAVYLRRRRSQS